MSWYKEGSLVIKRGGNIAVAAKCCCGGCCSCQNLQDAWQLGFQAKVTISGAITGICSMGSSALDPGQCIYWQLELSTPFCNEQPKVESCGLHLSRLHFHCPNGVALTDLTLEALISNLGCNFVGDGSVALYPPAVARKPNSVTCDPFTARYIFPLEDTQPGGCGYCSANYVQFDLKTQNPGDF